MSHEDFDSRDDTLLEIRHNTLSRALLITSISVAIWIVTSNLYNPSLPWPATALALLVAGVCGVSYAFRSQRLGLAIYIFVIGLWLCNALASAYFGLPAFLYLFSLINLLSMLLISRVPAIGLTVISMAFLSGVGLEKGWNETVISALAITVVTLLTSHMAFHSLYQALDIAWNYESYAVRQMNEAREHRGQLAKLTKALQDARSDLERANVQLRHARDAAEESRRLKAQFAANVSHELRTPINLIVGFSEMMAMAPQAYGVPLPTAYRPDMRTLYRSAKHLQSLINDVLDVSQIEAGQMAVIKEEVDPGEVIQEAASMIRDLIESKGLSLKVILPEQTPTMRLDRTRIRQVLLNLLGNATRFTDEGTITVGARLDDNALVIYISDTGIGIRQQDLERVFEEFQQLESSLSRRQGGTGLGLTLSKKFVDLHGGQLRVESEGVPGKGSTFYVTLPMSPDPAIWDSAVQTPPSSAEDEARYFLVLDNDPAIIQLFERYSHKHKAIGVQDQDEALRLLNTIRPTALVVDRDQLCTGLVESVQASSSQTPIISCNMPSGRRAMQVYGVADYLVKPVSYEALQKTLDRLGTSLRDIVIIDDDQDIVRMFSRMLQAMSTPYRVRKAYSGREGLALILQQCPEVVILDLLMPDMDGFDIIQHMKRDPLLMNIPIVLASARGAAEAIAPSSEGSLSVFKPSGFQPIELVRSVEALVEVFSPARAPGR